MDFLHRFKSGIGLGDAVRRELSGVVRSNLFVSMMVRQPLDSQRFEVFDKQFRIAVPVHVRHAYRLSVVASPDVERGTENLRELLSVWKEEKLAH